MYIFDLRHNVTKITLIDFQVSAIFNSTKEKKIETRTNLPIFTKEKVVVGNKGKIKV